ncbi:hypothetical protein EGW08_007593 [Elysia chlorotica]|uniref:Uncharacterized protein n=1 Tax=Elysia chlorotica TaxID=188477 RepID=A0A433TST1_ELYCH|nr:hypothetical protein EGW08_007593 [Elysia chlorotica]
MQRSQSRDALLAMLVLMVASHVVHCADARADYMAYDISAQIRALCRSLCFTSAALCPPKCYEARVSKRALRVSRGPNFRNIRLRVNSASAAPSSSFDDYLFSKFLGQNMIGGNGAPGGH